MVALALPVVIATVILGVTQFDLWTQVLTWRFLALVIMTVGVAVVAAFVWGIAAHRPDASEHE